mmetsp:Transcript_17930/g.36048  ORF Transcript_17930/g.36048 Transcript_17930/m.36048 type:complete len:110 (+) Transcript_17930:180-509(+)
MNSYQGCPEYTKKIYWCVACKEYCCYYGHQISYPEPLPLPPLVEDTHWHQLWRRNIRNPSKESMESEEAGFELRVIGIGIRMGKDWDTSRQQTATGYALFYTKNQMTNG